MTLADTFAEEGQSGSAASLSGYTAIALAHEPLSDLLDRIVDGAHQSAHRGGSTSVTILNTVIRRTWLSAIGRKSNTVACRCSTTWLELKPNKYVM
jgi:hypothetical protein